MDIKVNGAMPVNEISQPVQVQEADGTFKFVLAGKIEDENLKEALTHMMNDIIAQGKKLSKRMDVRDMKHYRTLIKSFMNEVTARSHKFSRENFLDRRGRHRVYGIVRLLDEKLDELARELCQDEKDNIAILGKIGEIQGLLLDIFT